MSFITSVSPPTDPTFKSPHDHCPLCIHSMVHPEEDSREPAIIFLDMDGVMIGDRFTHLLAGKIRSTLDDLFPESKKHNDYEQSIGRYDYIHPSEYQWAVAKGRHLHPDALKNLHNLISRIDKSGRRALVVLSTAWRIDATLQQHREEVFTSHTFCKYLCGKTAPEKRETQWAPECKQGFEFAKGAKDSFKIDLDNRSGVIEFWLRDHGFNPDSTNFVVIDDCEGEKRKRFGNRFIKTNYILTAAHVEEASMALGLV